MRIYRRNAIALIGLISAVSLCVPLYFSRQARPVMAGLDTPLPAIIIDAGHGGIDGGAVGEGGIVEKDINLAICLTMRDIFKANGFDVIMTRETDISIHDEGITNARKQKVSDLHNRLAIVNSYSNAIFISIHQNKFGNKNAHGAQIFYSPNNGQSEKLAETIQRAFVQNLQPENNRQIKKAGKNLYLMYKSTCPAVLVECGFLSNKNEAEMLIVPEYQAKVAFTTFSAVMAYLGMDEPNPAEP